MAKRRKTPPARKPRRATIEEHSLLIRSAETLGRVIGVLQRQLDDASRRLGAGADDYRINVDGPDENNSKKKKTKKTKKTTKTKTTTKTVRKKKAAPKRKRTRQ